MEHFKTVKKPGSSHCSASLSRYWTGRRQQRDLPDEFHTFTFPIADVQAQGQSWAPSAVPGDSAHGVRGDGCDVDGMPAAGAGAMHAAPSFNIDLFSGRLLAAGEDVLPPPRGRRGYLSLAATVVGIVFAVAFWQHVHASSGSVPTAMPCSPLKMLLMAAAVTGCAALAAKAAPSVRNAAGRAAGALLDRGREAGSAAHLEEHAGHVVRWRGDLYVLQHVAGADAKIRPLHSEGLLLRPVPAREVQLEGAYDDNAGCWVVWETYHFRVSARGRKISLADLETFVHELLAHLKEPCTVATRVWSRLPPQAHVQDQQRPLVIEKLQIYYAEVVVQFAVACDDSRDFLLQRWLLQKTPAEGSIAAAARQVCPAHELRFEEGSVQTAEPGDG